MPLFSGTDLVLYFFFYGFLAWITATIFVSLKEQCYRNFGILNLSTCTNHDFLDFPILRKKGQHSGITVYDLSLWYFYKQHIFIFST